MLTQRLENIIDNITFLYKVAIHSTLTTTENNTFHYWYNRGGIYKSPFKIQSRKRSTKLILTQSVDQTKLNKPTRPSSTTMITLPKQQ